MPKGEQLDLERLNPYLQSLDIDIPIFTSYVQFKGGFSNLTFQLGEDFVLRKPPKGAKEIKGGHDMGREYQILHTLLASGFDKVPKVLHLCEDETIIDDTFYIMRKVEGRILRAADTKWLLKNSSEEQNRTLSNRLCEMQASLHSIDITGTTLAQIGKPEGYATRQVKGWHKRYLASMTDEIPAMHQAFEWLEENIPTSSQISLLHNDYKYDNVVFDESTWKINALLDWEMCTIGDPLMDLGASLAYWVEAGENDFLKAFNISWLPGNLSRQAYLEQYTQLTRFDTSNILFYYVFGLVKNATIIQQIYSRFKKGLTQDPRFGQIGVGVGILGRKAVGSIEKEGMF